MDKKFPNLSITGKLGFELVLDNLLASIMNGEIRIRCEVCEGLIVNHMTCSNEPCGKLIHSRHRLVKKGRIYCLSCKRKKLSTDSLQPQRK